MEYLDIVTEEGHPTGQTVSREQAHTNGILHRTAHIWIIKQTEQETQVLLQKRSMNKDSFPGRFDTSSAGHIKAGDEPGISAIRELNEELGICATEEQLQFIGNARVNYQKEFHGRLFCDNEVLFVFCYREPVCTQRLILQKEEVEAVQWFSVSEVYKGITEHNQKFCVPIQGFRVLLTHLGLEP